MFWVDILTVLSGNKKEVELGLLSGLLVLAVQEQKLKERTSVLEEKAIVMNCLFISARKYAIILDLESWHFMMKLVNLLTGVKGKNIFIFGVGIIILAFSVSDKMTVADIK